MTLRRAAFLSSERTMCARVVVPPFAGRQIHHAQLPLTDRIVDARLEPPLLFLVADLEPQLDERYTPGDDVLLDFGTPIEEASVLVRRAKPHDVLDAGAVVPAAIEDHDFAGSGEVLHVPLHVHLRLLAVRRRRQRDDAKHAWTDAFGQRADGAAFAGAVASLEDDDDALALRLHPVLQVAQLDLQFSERFLVLGCLHYW
jgi:hypothetical protein